GSPVPRGGGRERCAEVLGIALPSLRRGYTERRMKKSAAHPAGDVATPASTLSYTVSIHPAQHELTIELRLTGPQAQGDVQLVVPTWAPGAYAFLPFARDLFNLKAVD